MKAIDVDQISHIAPNNCLIFTVLPQEMSDVTLSNSPIRPEHRSPFLFNMACKSSFESRNSASVAILLDIS